MIAAPRAVISPCRLYRYVLRRDVDPILWTFPPIEGFQVTKSHGKMTFVMLNPSTADAEKDDPTIRRCISFARGSGAASMEVVNLYALRATNPSELNRGGGVDPIGPRNDEYILESVHTADIVICAWGTTDAPRKASRIVSTLKIIEECGRAPMCLGVSKFGDPLHPLYLAKTRRPVGLYEARAAL